MTLAKAALILPLVLFTQNSFAAGVSTSVGVACGDALYMTKCVTFGPECHWLLGGGLVERHPLEVDLSTYGKTLRSKFDKTWGTTSFHIEIEEFIPKTGAPQYMASMDATIDGKYHAYTQSREAEAFLMSGIVTPEQKGAGVWCKVLDFQSGE